MISKKVSMLGLWGAGKTSMVSRFVNQVFDEKYHATLGVKMDTKILKVGDTDLKMVLWDIAGTEDVFDIPMHYIAGSAAYILVLDGTRRESFEKGFDLVEKVKLSIGDLPYTIAINKSDLDWEVSEQEINQLLPKGASWIKTSAKTGHGVEEAFLDVSKKLV
ncbi:Rab family GTPase [Arenicella sp. 4NH20-0111]|uniref:Rab family GTPase n=1 Tax=Arenicella sp. 4NH20-0111 TaxID=3127648 RepID=UPI00333E330E